MTAISAARVGALDLAVGDQVGSSALDFALLSLADVVYTDGSILSLLEPPELTLIGVALGITSLLVIGLARRDPSPLIALESCLMLAVYGPGAVTLISLPNEPSKLGPPPERTSQGSTDRSSVRCRISATESVEGRRGRRVRTANYPRDVAMPLHSGR